MTYRFSITDDKRIRVIIDTDADCEADDPFAITHALLTPKFIVKGICAEHFNEEGSMERSYRTALRITTLLDSSVPVLQGSTTPLDPNTDGAPHVNHILLSAASQAIIYEAQRDDPHPLYILCLGAITNVAAAIQQQPSIIPRLHIIWIGTQLVNQKETPIREFNSGNDVTAANIVLSSGADLWLVPYTVYRTMHISIAELQWRLSGTGPIGDFLFTNLTAYNEGPYSWWTSGESWSLGDSPAVGIAIKPDCGTFHYAPAPVIHHNSTSSFSADRPLIRIYDSVDSRFILEDMFAKLHLHAQP